MNLCLTRHDLLTIAIGYVVVSIVGGFAQGVIHGLTRGTVQRWRNRVP